MKPTLSADQLRELGNKAIKAENYKEADQLYTQALIQDQRSYKLLSNRALARLKLHDYAGAAEDAERAAAINPAWMKAYRHAAVAYRQLGRHDDAVTAATQAYLLCLDGLQSGGVSGSRNDLLPTSELVLQSRQARWEARERQRLAGSDPLLNECIDMLWASQERAELDLDARLANGDIDTSQRDKEADQAWQQAHTKEKTLREVFAKTDPKLAVRSVPDCFIDRISFTFMIDPVVTKNGHSYERSQILEHLQRNPTDPLTGEKLQPEDLRPNISLREACEAFLRENEWAADF